MATLLRGTTHQFIGAYTRLEPGQLPPPELLCTRCEQPYDYSYHSAVPVLVTPETIAEEASRIVYGDREQTYDDPNRNFNKLALMWTGHLLTKLRPGEQVTARDVAMMQQLLKISREGFAPKRDNRVDMIGYALCLERIVQAEEGTDNNAK